MHSLRNTGIAHANSYKQCVCVCVCVRACVRVCMCMYIQYVDETIVKARNLTQN